MKTTFIKIILATILCATIWSCEKVTKTDDGWVDLGLPSGLLWASCNVGADKPQDYGDYFAWGETKTKVKFTENNYNCRDIYDGNNDWASTLMPSDDAATTNLGAPVKIPTKEEWEELINNCEMEWISYKGKEGHLITGPNGNSIFIPAAGFKYQTELKDKGKYHYYWSSSHVKNDQGYAHNMYGYQSNIYVNRRQRCMGLTIRPVKPANQD